MMLTAAVLCILAASPGETINTYRITGSIGVEPWQESRFDDSPMTMDIEIDMPTGWFRADFGAGTVEVSSYVLGWEESPTRIRGGDLYEIFLSSSTPHPTMTDRRSLWSVDGWSRREFNAYNEGIYGTIETVELTDSQEAVFPGDANQDGRVEFDDILQVLSRDLFETGQPATWGDGDWNQRLRPGMAELGDGVFDFNDILFALPHFENDNRFASSVPEPVLLAMLFPLLLCGRRRSL